MFATTPVRSADILFQSGWNNLYSNNVFVMTDTELKLATGESTPWYSYISNENLLNELRLIHDDTPTNLRKFRTNENEKSHLIVPRLLPDKTGLVMFVLGTPTGEYLYFLDREGHATGYRELEPFSHIEYNTKGHYFIEISCRKLIDGNFDYDYTIDFYDDQGNSLGTIESYLELVINTFNLNINFLDDYGRKITKSVDAIFDYPEHGQTSTQRATAITITGITFVDISTPIGPFMTIDESELFGIGISGYCLLLDKFGNVKDHWRFDGKDTWVNNYEPAPSELKWDHYSNFAKIRKTLKMRLTPVPDVVIPESRPVIELLKQK